MPRPRVYTDEDVAHAIAAGLRRRGFDVLTTPEAARQGSSDAEQLAFATESGRVLVTFNRGDFARLHTECIAAGEHHAGVIVSRQAGVGPVVRALLRILARHDADWFTDRLVWLRVQR